MYQPNYYTLSFMMRSARSTRTGEAPIYARITVSGQRAEFNINRNIDPENWNTAKGMSKGRSKRDIELNKYLESIRARISEIHAQLVKDEEVITPVILKNHYLGNIAGPRMLVETFNGVVAQYKEKLEMGDICLCTFLRWERCGKYLAEFLNKREGFPDIPIKKLTSGMIDDFEHFLRVTKENGNNAAVKYIRYLKKVTRIALANKWMDEDPFINKRYTRTQAKREALNEDELKRIMSLNLTDLPSLEKVREPSSSAVLPDWRLLMYPRFPKRRLSKTKTENAGYTSILEADLEAGTDIFTTSEVVKPSGLYTTTAVPYTRVSSRSETAPTAVVIVFANCFSDSSSSFHENSYARGILVPV